MSDPDSAQLVPLINQSSLVRVLGTPSRSPERSSSQLLVTWARALRGRDARVLVRERVQKSNVRGLMVVSSSAPDVSASVLSFLHQVQTETGRSSFVVSRAGIRRIARANAEGTQRDTIAEAAVDDGDLRVMSCEPRVYRIPLGKIPALEKVNENAARELEISPSGSRITWPALDVDLGMEPLRQIVDPKARQMALTRMAAHLESQGAAIRAVRQAHKLRQDDIAGVDSRTVRRIEAGETRARAETLRKLAAAHGLEPNTYLAEVAAAAR